MRPGDDAALLVGFLNTVHVPDGVDLLPGSSPAQWIADGRRDDGRSAHAGAGTTSRGGARRDTASLVALREGLRALLADRDCPASVDGARGTREMLAEADAVLRSAPLSVSLTGGDGGPTLVPTRMPPGGRDLAAVATAVIRSHCNGSLGRVKVCARPACRWAFFDASRNASRHWCSMAGCGNVEKNRAYRSRRSSS